MAYDSCNPCCNPNIAFSSNESARFNTGLLLCRILEALGGSGVVPTTYDAHVAFGAITTLWTVAMANIANLGTTRFYNSTNQPLQISTDGGTNYFTVASGATFVAEWLIATDLSVKALVAPVSGELEIYAVS